MDEYTRTNRALWDGVTEVHVGSRFYDVESFRKGRCSLLSLEVEELGDVRGKSMLHLQCHFGMDTLSWARRGAEVTGLDFSQKAIEAARKLSKQIDVSARFVCADLYDAASVLSGEFDIVYTTYGVLCWLRDLPAWGRIVEGFLTRGGVFYVADIHPVAYMLEESASEGTLRIGEPYFHDATPERYDEDGTYADREAKLKHTVSYEWSYGLGEIVSAVASAGLRVEFLHEFPYLMYQKHPFMVRGEDGWWRIEGPLADRVPLLFSLKATKP